MAFNLAMSIAAKAAFRGGLQALRSALRPQYANHVRFRTEIEGLDHVVDTLKGLPNELGLKILATATRKEAVRWRDLARDLAPGPSDTTHAIKYDDAYKYVEPGNLKKNIVVRKVRLEGNEKGWMFAYSVAVNKKEAYYWTWHEFGAPNRNIQARGFMRAAFDKMAHESLERVKMAAKDKLDAYFKKQARLARNSDTSRMSKRERSVVMSDFEHYMGED